MKILHPLLKPGEKGNPARSSSGEGPPPSPIPAPPVVSTAGSQNREPVDFLSRLLVQLPRRGEILARLSSIPQKERSHALIILLTLAEKNISLNQDEWDELWSLMRKPSASVPSEDGDGRRFFSPLSHRQGAEEIMIQEHHRGNLSLIPIHDGERRGQIALKHEEGSDNLFIRMETETRHWEFHLVQPRKGKIKSILHVFTNDRRLINEPPPEWDHFCKEMKKKSINVVRKINFLRRPLFLAENGSRELDHLVDIVL